MKKILLFSFMAVLMLPMGVFAQASEIPQNTGSSLSIDLPKPIGDFVDSLNKIKFDKTTTELPDSLQGGEKLIGQRIISESQIGEWWNKINSWLMQNIGISFSEILRTVGNFVVWGFELVIKLLKAGLSYLPV